MTERELIASSFEFAKGLAELKLTEEELALFSAFILFDPSE
jgi:Na+-transporting NADH:ubiquinone oxidoreductase subunit NqrA